MIGPTPLLDFFKRGEVARDVRLSAAKGELAPRAYEQLAILYRGRKDYAAEVAILERCQQQLHRRGQPAFAERLAKARALRDKTT